MYVFPSDTKMNETTRADLLSLKEKLLEQIAHIDAVLSIGENIGLNGTKERIFNPKASYQEKIAKVLLNAERFLNITQIIEIIQKETPNVNRDDIKSGVNSAKAILLKEGSISKITVGASNQNSFYGSPKWLDTNGNIQPRYMYDESLIKEKKKIEI